MFKFRAMAQQVRQIHTSDVLLKAAVKKSFSRSGVNTSKSKKGSGKTASFKKLLVTAKYDKKASPSIIAELPTFEQLKTSTDFDRVVKFEDEINQKLHIIGSLQKNQFHELFAQPISLLKNEETKELLNFIETSKTNSSENNKLILTGDAGVGKSTVLTHFHSLINYKESILVPFTNTESLFDGTLDYKFNPVTELYDHPMFSKKFLRKFKNVNSRDILTNFKLKENFYMSQSESNKRATLVAGKHSLMDLISLPFNNVDNKLSAVVRLAKVDTTLVMSHLLKELTNSENSYNTYLSIDNFTAFTHFNYTNLRDVENIPIHVTKFQISKTLLDIISSKISFPKGGVILATSSRHRSSTTIPLALQTEFEDLPDLYAKSKELDFELANLLATSNLKQVEINKFTVEQIKQLLLVYLRMDIIHNENNLEAAGLAPGQLAEYSTEDLHKLSLPALEKLARSKYIISGNGNPRDFINSCVLAYV